MAEVDDSPRLRCPRCGVSLTAEVQLAGRCEACGREFTMQELSEIERDLIVKEREGRRTRFAERAGAVLGLLMIVAGYYVVVRSRSGSTGFLYRPVWSLTVATIGILAYCKLNHDPMHKPLLLLGAVWFGLALLDIVFHVGVGAH